MEQPTAQSEQPLSWRNPGITMEKEEESEARRDRSTLPDVPSDGVLVKTICAGLHRQKHIGDEGNQNIYSNEICGRVLSVGSKIPTDCSVKPGDVVIIYPWLGCGQCETCSSGSTYLCEETGSDIKNSSEPNSFALSHYLVVQEWQNLVKLPKEIPKDIGCMLPYWALRVYAAILDAKPSFEQAVLIRGFANLLVIGCSNLELWCIAFLKNVFCDRNVKVICAESDQASLNLALESGADDAVLWKEGASVEETVDATTMNGYNKMDVVIDLVGDATAFTVAFLALHNGGTILELGTKVEQVDLPLALLVEKSVTVRAIKAGSRYTLKQLVDLLAIQRVTLSIPVESYYIEDLNLARENLDKGLVKGHAIIRYNE